MITIHNHGFPGGSDRKESACSVGDPGSIPGLGRSPGVGNGYLLQYSGLENSTDCIVHGVAKTWTQLSDLHSLHFCYIILVLKTSEPCYGLGSVPGQGAVQHTQKISELHIAQTCSMMYFSVSSPCGHHPDQGMEYFQNPETPSHAPSQPAPAPRQPFV